MRILSYPRRFMASLLYLSFSVFACSSPAIAGTTEYHEHRAYNEHQASSDVLGFAYAIKPFDELIVNLTPLYGEPEQVWRSQRIKHLLEKQAKATRRQGLSYRMNRQPSVKGAPVII